jgi:hypothetical protein
VPLAPSSPELPWSSSEGVGLGGECSHGADVDDVAGELRVKQLLHVGAHLHVIATPCCAKVIHARYLTRKPAMDGGLID